MRFGGDFTYIQLNYAYGTYYQAVEALGNNTAGAMTLCSMPVASSKTASSQVRSFSSRLASMPRARCLARPTSTET